MSTDDAAHRAKTVAQLELLLYEVDVESLILDEPVNSKGLTALRTTALPRPDAWPINRCRELWLKSALLIPDGVVYESDADGGLSRWLLTRSQPFSRPAVSLSRLANPINVWLNEVRCPGSTARRIGPTCTCLASADPERATEMDFLIVADKARVLVEVLRKCSEECEKLEKSLWELRPKKDQPLSKDENQYLQMQRHSLRWAKWNWSEWSIYAELVWHYSSSLLPDDLAECRQVSSRSWSRLKETDWPVLEKELLRLASKLEWLKPTHISGATSPNNSFTDATPKSHDTTMVTNRQRLRRSLQSARDELVLARERATTFEELSPRSWRAVVQACRALHADVSLESPAIPHDPFWTLVKKPTNRWSDKEAFNWWLIFVCSWARSTSTVWAGGAGSYDFTPSLTNSEGRFVDHDGKEIAIIENPDGSFAYAEDFVHQMQVENESERMIRMQLRAKDWLDVIDRILEIVDEQPVEDDRTAPITLITGNAGFEAPKKETPVELGPPADLLHELTPQQVKIVKFLWNAKHATNWQSLPDDCWRGGRSTNDQNDRAIESALERLRDKLNSLPAFGCSLEVHSASRTTKLVHNPPRK